MHKENSAAENDGQQRGSISTFAAFFFHRNSLQNQQTVPVSTILADLFISCLATHACHMMVYNELKISSLNECEILKDFIFLSYSYMHFPNEN